MTGPTPLVDMRGVVRTFGSVQALRGADFSLTEGETHALLGENGAGKTTLMHVLFGMEEPDAGTVTLAGRLVRYRSPAEAMRDGIGMVHQHFMQVPRMTVAENVWLGRPGWRFDRREARALVRRVGEATGLHLDPDTAAESLSVGMRQRLEIVKALARDVRVLILDEPTAALTPAEADELFAALRRLTTTGVAIVFITHKLREVAAIAHRVTVLRAGSLALTGAAAEFSAADLATAMIGGEAAPATRDAALGARIETTARPGEPALRVAGLRVARVRGAAVTGASFDVRRGEIVGLAAVEGNGQHELLRAVAGLLPSGGVIERAGPAGFVPEDRQGEGLILDFSVADNLALGSPRGAWRRRSARHAAARATIAGFDIRGAEPERPVRQLSGGNQQKLVLAREMARRPGLLVAENPTRGLDLHAAADIHARLRAAARVDGLGVLFHSSDLDEVLALADRVAVMVNGAWTWVPSDRLTRDAVGAMMLGQEAA